MTENFCDYARYYDLLYRAKDYDSEAVYIKKLLRQFAPGSRSILELGCGTGRHAELLARGGLHVTGVEVSAEMLQQSERRALQVREEHGENRFQAIQGDVRSVRMNKHFDAVVSLFHVVSYQISNDDVMQMFKTASDHLTCDGIFIFDVWYGPAVLSMLPSVRVKRLEDEKIEVMRIAEPTLDFNQNRVDVFYTVLITDRRSGAVEQLHERHPMRYYFAPELDLLAQQVGMEIVRSEEWLTGQPPSEKTWGVTFIARKK